MQGSGNRGLVAGLPWLDALHGNHDVLLCDGGDKLTLDREVVLGLVDACDAYVSLHRAEGFGRTLAEGMLLGKPVVGTDFSGNTDFLTQDTGYPVKWTRLAVAPGEYPFIEPADQAWWAEPDVGHAARQMRAARAAAGSPWALQLPQQVAEQFSPEAIGARMRTLLRQRFEGLAAKPRIPGGTGS